MSSRFEFFGKTAIGQYIPRESWFHQRDPRARLIGLTAIFFGALFAKGLYGLGIAIITTMLIYIIAKLPLKSACESIRRALPFILILAILQILFTEKLENEITLIMILGIRITKLAVLNAGILILRFIILIGIINLIVMSVSTAQVTSALFYLLKPLEKIRFPVNDLTMVIQITLRFLPLVTQTAEKIAKSQAARGGDWEQRGFNPVQQAKRILPLIIPIIVTSLQRAETMAVAMESRGFNAAHRRSSFYFLKFTFQDGILIIISIIFSMLIIFINASF